MTSILLDASSRLKEMVVDVPQSQCSSILLQRDQIDTR